MNISVEGIILPNVPLSNHQLIDSAKNLKLKSFRGVFCRDELPKKPRLNECGILNLDDSGSNGTHWTAWLKKDKAKIYFDGYGLLPPTELTDYLDDVLYNTERIQPDNTVFCGHLCLYVLAKLQETPSQDIAQGFQNIINNLY